MRHLILLSIAGAAGPLARYGVYSAAQRLPGDNLPLATLVVNVAGSFLFGLIWAMAEQGRVSASTRVLLLSGFMGAFTTFSAFAFETGQMLRASQYVLAGLNLAANNVLGIGAFLVGLSAAKL